MFRKKVEVTSNTIDIAKTIVNRCLRRGYKIYPAKLERMMIIAYGEYLVKTDKKLFETKFTVSRAGIHIQEIQEEFKHCDGFRELFVDDKIFLASEDVIFRNLIDEYGDKNFAYVDSDPRIKALKEFKRITKKLSDKEIYQIFKNVPKRVIETPILCSASEKAKWIINGCLKAGFDINTFKLEKLLIIAYGEYLIKTGKKLFNEKIVVWETGLNIREVNRDFIKYAMGFYAPFCEYYLKLDAEEKLIDSIIFEYGNMDAFKLNDNIRLKELEYLKNSDGFVSEEDIKKVFGKYTLI